MSGFTAGVVSWLGIGLDVYPRRRQCILTATLETHFF